ncbi:L-rhamnose/proton symporter RhaT [Luteolibacter algae]|uniref:L-rhamnose/proton symporter RhaT n=1 Tax=Luteolibacter algae TaxID=454151 RepID=A0ABW5DAG2_9BACT
MIIEGIIWAVISGLMLGLYALPAKFTKGFQEENTWGLFFMQTMFLVPILATLTLMKGVGDIYSTPAVQEVLPVMIVSAVLWGIGVMMWGKAIHHIGLSLGFSIFIGTVILVGSVLPIGIGIAKSGVEGLPEAPVLALILLGIAIVLLGILFNGRAGLVREAEEKISNKDAAGKSGKKSMGAGIAIAVIGGLLATGFNVAFTVGGEPLGEAVAAAGNPPWMVSLAVMLVVFLSGGVIMAGYFGWQITSKKAWGSFKTPAFGLNFVLIFVMAVFHYAASVGYGYGAGLFELGPVVVYAIFNTTCVVVAVISGIYTKEWINASSKARNSLYTGLSAMVLGVVILAGSQYLSTKKGEVEPAAPAEAALPDA